MTIEAPTKVSDRKVSFNNRVTVVLIPERKEIKEAKCDLWWNRNDFVSFQQSAHSEIRLYAMYENINCKEAKNMLYQPSEKELAKYKTEEVDVAEDEWEELAMPSEDSEDQVPEEGTFSPILIRHVDSVSLLTGLDSEKKDAPSTPTKQKSSNSLSTSDSAAKLRTAEEDKHLYISLCVPAKEYEPLAESCQGGGGKKSKGRIDQSSGFAVVCGIFSFTLPIIGYYLMHYSN